MTRRQASRLHFNRGRLGRGLRAVLAHAKVTQCLHNGNLTLVSGQNGNIKGSARLSFARSW